jgi:hypothetical protein
VDPEPSSAVCVPSGSYTTGGFGGAHEESRKMPNSARITRLLYRMGVPDSLA